MGKKRWSGLSLFVIGALIVVYSLGLMKKIEEAKKDLHTLAHPLSEHALGKAFNKKSEHKMGGYSIEVWSLLSLGILLTCSGGYILYTSRKK
jgi:hypothetical protein